jgi:hypothetical protein
VLLLSFPEPWLLQGASLLSGEIIEKRGAREETKEKKKLRQILVFLLSPKDGGAVVEEWGIYRFLCAQRFPITLPVSYSRFSLSSLAVHSTKLVNTHSTHIHRCIFLRLINNLNSYEYRDVWRISGRKFTLGSFIIFTQKMLLG